MKICFKCNIEKDIIDFYRHPKTADGYLNKCKSCTKKDTEETRQRIISTPEGLEKEKDRHRDKYHRLGYKDIHKPSPEKKKEIMERYENKFPEKKRAHSSSYRIRPVVYGNEMHHWSYNSEHYKDMIELSILEHNKLHRYIIYDQERMMYRRIDTNELLDTKERHIEFYNYLKEKP